MDRVRIELFDITGRKVSQVLDKHMPSGDHSLSFDTSSLEPGIYQYRLSAGSLHSIRQMQVL
jgi:hypothetical protein